MSAQVWDEFIDRVITAQRNISRHGGSPHQYTAHVHPAHYVQLTPYLGQSVLPIEADPALCYGQVVLRHEVVA